MLTGTRCSLRLALVDHAGSTTTFESSRTIGPECIWRREVAVHHDADEDREGDHRDDQHPHEVAFPAIVFVHQPLLGGWCSRPSPSEADAQGRPEQLDDVDHRVSFTNRTLPSVRTEWPHEARDVSLTHRPEDAAVKTTASVGTRGHVRATRIRKGCGHDRGVQVDSEGAAFLISALLAVTWATASVSATIVDRETVSDTYQFDVYDCGYRLHVTGAFTDEIQVRADQNPDINHATTRHDFKETWTADDGRWFTVSGHNLFKDIRLKRVEGTLYEGVFNIPGQTSTICDASGRIVRKDGGNVSFDYTIDFADGSFNVVSDKIAGPHPSFDTDVCLAVAPLTGGDSAKYLTERPIGSTELPDGLRRVPAAELHAERREEPAAAVLPRLRRDRRRDARGAIERLVQAGIPKYINVGGWDTSRPFVVLAMQHVEEPPGFDWSACQDVYPWGGSCNMQLQHDRGNVQPAFCTTPDEVHDFIDYAVAHYNVDPTRVYITGLSCGAFGIWEYLAKYAADRRSRPRSRSPARAPGLRADYCALGADPIWAFHGLLDDVVDPQGSIEPMTALQDCPGVPADRAMLTTYPDRDHNSWDPAYSGAAATTSTPGCSASPNPEVTGQRPADPGCVK